MNRTTASITTTTQNKHKKYQKYNSNKRTAKDEKLRNLNYGYILYSDFFLFI